jgi:hypothetical protein
MLQFQSKAIYFLFWYEKNSFDEKGKIISLGWSASGGETQLYNSAS